MVKESLIEKGIFKQGPQELQKLTVQVCGLGLSAEHDSMFEEQTGGSVAGGD